MNGLEAFPIRFIALSMLQDRIFPIDRPVEENFSYASIRTIKHG